MIVFVVIVVALAFYSHHLDSNQTHRNCIAIENLKAGQRDSAQATIDGDKKLLEDHDKHGMPLPVPRQAVLDDIAAKQKTVDRYPPRKCP